MVNAGTRYPQVGKYLSGPIKMQKVVTKPLLTAQTRNMAVTSPEALAQASRDLDLLDSSLDEVAQKLPDMWTEVRAIRARLDPGGRRPAVVRRVLAVSRH